MNENNKENLKFNAEISKVLQLMIHSLYTNKDIFVRELVSNASDACDKLRHLAITQPELTKGDSEFKINLLIDKENNAIAISDNGIGMSREELIQNLGTIAKSGTQEFLSKLTGDSKRDMPLIGQFGVGFYSSYMVADKVTVVSRRAGSDDAWQWESDGQGEFTVEPVSENARGTKITLHLKKDAEEYLDSFRLRHIVQTYSDHISFPISITDDESKTETVNTASALWMRPKSEITPEQYKEFYHHVAHQPDDPWLILHNKAEGKLEYTNLLFIPSMKPFDLFHQDRKRRVKLYVKRVFITEDNVDLVPQWLRFVRGIVDSEDLPLNISRETLQASPMLAKIREAVTKRVLLELKKIANPVNVDMSAEALAKAEDVAQDPAQSLRASQDYHAFWKNFGPVLKEGLCESHAPRESIFEVCRFYSTQSEELTSLDAYISRMKPEQEYLYYLIGDNLAALKASPQIEGFAKRGIEVLLMCDHVDDFWVNVAHEYKDKKFKSVTRADIDLDKIAKEEKPTEEKIDEDAVKKLCARMKEILGADKVKDVRPTSKLSQSAVCLAVEEGAMDMRFERFLIEQKQLVGEAAKILEINPAHPIIKALATKLDPHPNLLPKREKELTSPSPFQGESRGEGSSELEDVTWLLFDQARILEGESISDPASFTRRLQGFVEKSLAA